MKEESHNLNFSDISFNNAKVFQYHFHQVPALVPVDDLIKESRFCFNLLAEEDSAISIKQKLWKIRAMVEFTLLPFDSIHLGLEQEFSKFCREVKYYPSVKDRLQNFEQIISFLITNPTNHKREYIFKLIGERPDSKPVGIIGALAKWSTPGWPEKIFDEFAEKFPQTEILVSRSMLFRKHYEKIIIPSSGRGSPIYPLLFSTFQTSKVVIVSYKQEGFLYPDEIHFPKASFNSKKQSYIKRAELVEAKEKITSIDNSIEQNIWGGLRRKAMSENQDEHERSNFHFIVKARLVLLNSNQQTFLADEGKVIEISDIVDGLRNLEEIKKSFPKKSVSRLREGDLIVLRTGGGGDYTQGIADILMKNDGVNSLRNEAAAWKINLKKALENFGPEKVASMLREEGENISSQNYLWYWTTNQIIGPESFVRFQNLMKVLESLDCSTPDCNVEMAQIFWERMKTIRHYHHAAGNSIRDALLNRLKTMLKNGITVKDVLPLSIPGMSSAEISVLRIAAVDNEISNVSYNRIGILMDL